MNNRIRRRGFTVLEVVVLIAVLGLLAAFAVPRMLSLETQARTAAVEALADSVRSGAALSHTLWLAGRRPGSVTVEGQTIEIINGYPTLATIGDTLPDTFGFTYDPTTGVFARAGRNGVCTVTYGQAEVDGVPSVTVATPACN